MNTRGMARAPLKHMKTQTFIRMGAAAFGLGLDVLSVRFFLRPVPPQGHVDPLLASRVELKGPILKNEIERLLAGVRALPGVESIDDDLEAHDRDEKIPELI